MIEAVENHMPEVIVIDEIGTEQEAHAARTIAERGVQLVATAHGNALANLVRNPTLSDLVGGVQAVTLGDDEARRRGTQKAVLERAAEPTFPLAVEMNSRSRWMVHGDVAATVDQLLRGQPSAPEVRSVGADGVLVVERPVLQGPRRGSLKRPPLAVQVVPLAAAATASERPLRVFCCGIAPRLVLQAARNRRWPVQLTDELLRADAVLAGRNQLGRHPELRKRARDGAVPIHVIKADSLPQVQRALERLLRRHGEAEIAQGV